MSDYCMGGKPLRKLDWRRGLNKFDRFGNAILISLLVGLFALYAAFGLRGVAAGLGVFGILNAVRLLGRWTR